MILIMKKFINCALALLLSLSTVSCALTAGNFGVKPFSETITEESAVILNNQRQGLIGDAVGSSPMFISYLGKLSGKVDETIASHLVEYKAFESYPYLAFLPDDHIVNAGGCELYLIVPLADDAKVTIRQWICDGSDNYGGKNGELLYKSNVGDPFILCCNEIGGTPNTSITIRQKKAGDVIDYKPRISQQNGRVVTEGLIKDHTGDILHCGIWTGQTTLETGAVCDVSLEFLPDNSLYFTWRSSLNKDGGISNHYRGTWTMTKVGALDDSMIAFDCDLTLSGGEDGVPKQIQNTLYAEFGAYWMKLYFLGGNELIPKQNESFTYGESPISLEKTAAAHRG